MKKGLKSLENPVLRGSFSLVLSNERLNFLDQIAKNAWEEITSRGLRTVNSSSPENKTVKLTTCPPNVVQKQRGGVYVIQNVENGKAVIGQTTNFDNRFNQYSARASRTKPTTGDSINKAYYQEVQAVKARIGNGQLAFQRYIVYSWVNEKGESLDLFNSRDLRNEMLYLEHRLILAFFECGLAYNTNDSAPQLNNSVTLESSLDFPGSPPSQPQPLDAPQGSARLHKAPQGSTRLRKAPQGIKKTKPFKVNGQAFRSMGDYVGYKDSKKEPRGNIQRLREKLKTNTSNSHSDTRYLTEKEIVSYEQKNLFISVVRASSPYKPRTKKKNP